MMQKPKKADNNKGSNQKNAIKNAPIRIVAVTVRRSKVVINDFLSVRGELVEPYEHLDPSTGSGRTGNI